MISQLHGKLVKLLDLYFHRLDNYLIFNLVFLEIHKVHENN